jgi:hypothetical protein
VLKLPTEDLRHVDGRAREAFVPQPVPGLGQAAGTEDPELAALLAWLRLP